MRKRGIRRIRERERQKYTREKRDRGRQKYTREKRDRGRQRERVRPFLHSVYVLRELLCCCYPEFLSVSLLYRRRAGGGI